MAEVLDRRVAIEEAFDSAEADAKGEPYTPPVHETDKTQNDTAEEVVEQDDPALVEAKATDKQPAKDRPRTRGVPFDERKPAEQVKSEEQDVAKPTSALDKPPTSWGPKRAELWAKIPSEARTVISKREAEIQQGMSQAGRIRQIAEEYHRTVQPFENIIRSMNSTPSEAIKNVMTTATALIVGTQKQKCAVITEMVQRYGVDLPELDKMLTEALKDGGGKLKYVGGQPVQQQAPLDPRLQPLFAMEQRLREAEGQKIQQLQQQATEAINSVANEQYFEDVREDMADIMEISAKRGHVMTIQQAYQKAIQIHPEISKLVTKAPASQDKLQRARRAASTVRGAPGGPVNSGKMDRRSAIEAAWDSV